MKHSYLSIAVAVAIGSSFVYASRTTAATDITSTAGQHGQTSVQPPAAKEANPTQPAAGQADDVKALNEEAAAIARREAARRAAQKQAESNRAAASVPNGGAAAHGAQ